MVPFVAVIISLLATTGQAENFNCEKKDWEDCQKVEDSCDLYCRDILGKSLLNCESCRSDENQIECLLACAPETLYDDRAKHMFECHMKQCLDIVPGSSPIDALGMRSLVNIGGIKNSALLHCNDLVKTCIQEKQCKSLLQLSMGCQNEIDVQQCFENNFTDGIGQRLVKCMTEFNSFEFLQNEPEPEILNTSHVDATQFAESISKMSGCKESCSLWNCGSEVNKCINDPQCIVTLKCVESCSSSDDENAIECTKECFEKVPIGIQNELMTCLTHHECLPTIYSLSGLYEDLSAVSSEVSSSVKSFVDAVSSIFNTSSMCGLFQCGSSFHECETDEKCGRNIECIRSSRGASRNACVTSLDEKHLSLLNCLQESRCDSIKTVAVHRDHQGNTYMNIPSVIRIREYLHPFSLVQKEMMGVRSKRGYNEATVYDSPNENDSLSEVDIHGEVPTALLMDQRRTWKFSVLPPEPVVTEFETKKNV